MSLNCFSRVTKQEECFLMICTQRILSSSCTSLFKTNVIYPQNRLPLSLIPKGLLQNGMNLFLIRERLMRNEMNLFLIQNRFMQNGMNLFLIQERFVRNRMDLFLIRKRSMPNGKNLFLIRGRLVQNGGNGYGVKKWRLYLYRYPIWRTASSTAD